MDGWMNGWLWVDGWMDELVVVDIKMDGRTGW